MRTILVVSLFVLAALIGATFWQYHLVEEAHWALEPVRDLGTRLFALAFVLVFVLLTYEIHKAKKSGR